MSTESTIHAHTSAIPEVSLPDTDGISHHLSEFTAAGPAVMVYARGAWCPFCLRQLADYGERYRDFKQSGIEVFAISPESPRRSRRLRKQLNLPFTVLSDAKFAVAQTFGLMGHEKPGEPTPATLVLDGHRGIMLSTLNQLEKCLLARDMLDYTRALKQEAVPDAVAPPQVDTPKAGFMLFRGLMNMAAGLVIR